MNLKIKGLSKQFTGKDKAPLHVLNDIHLTIKSGEFISILGPSGCGKSTLLSMIAGLSTPTTGAIYLGNQMIQGPHPDRGVVFQESALFPWMNVEENVMFPLRKRMKKKERKQIADHFLRKVQLAKFKQHYPHELSGGMQQRVSIARVLAMDSKLFLMDEPFGALDEQTRIVLQDEVEKIWLETQKTIIFVTHSIREAIKLSDRIIIMGARPGRVISDFQVPLARPRRQDEMATLEQEIMAILKSELDKVIQEELGYASGV